MLSGILKAVGAQLFSSISMFVSFYVIGSSISLSLLFRTNLQVHGNEKKTLNKNFDYFKYHFLKGFFIGVLIAELFLVFSQLIYIYNIDWNASALKVIV